MSILVLAAYVDPLEQYPY